MLLFASLLLGHNILDPFLVEKMLGDLTVFRELVWKHPGLAGNKGPEILIKCCLENLVHNFPDPGVRIT